MDDYYRPNYNDPVTGYACKACPTGMNCLSGDILPAAGFWRENYRASGSGASGRSVALVVRAFDNGDTLPNDAVYQCNLESACVGGGSEACAEGYTGPLCDVCVDQYKKFGEICQVGGAGLRAGALG